MNNETSALDFIAKYCAIYGLSFEDYQAMVRVYFKDPEFFDKYGMGPLYREAVCA